MPADAAHPSAAPLDLDAHNLAFDERVVRHENGHLMIERVPLPDEERIAKLFASLSKAWPILAQHASYMDGEFDLALTDLRSVVKFLVAAARRGGADTEGPSEKERKVRWQAYRSGFIDGLLQPSAVQQAGYEAWNAHAEAHACVYADAYADVAARAALPPAPQEDDHA